MSLGHKQRPLGSQGALLVWGKIETSRLRGLPGFDPDQHHHCRGTLHAEVVQRRCRDWTTPTEMDARQPCCPFFEQRDQLSVSCNFLVGNTRHMGIFRELQPAVARAMNHELVKDSVTCLEWI